MGKQAAKCAKFAKSKRTESEICGQWRDYRAPKDFLHLFLQVLRVFE